MKLTRMKAAQQAAVKSGTSYPAKKRSSDDAAAAISWGRKSKDPEQQRELKKVAVLRTAATAFLEKGYHETTIDDIAMRLNVTKPSIYAYVETKEQILVECARLGYERLDELLNWIETQPGKTVDRLRLFFRAYAVYAMDEFGMVLVMLSDRAVVEENKLFIHDKKADIQKRIRKLVAEGIADGSIRDCRAAHVSEVLVSTFNGLYHWYHPKGELSLEQTVDELLNIIFFGIASNRSRTS